MLPRCRGSDAREREANAVATPTHLVGDADMRLLDTAGCRIALDGHDRHAAAAAPHKLRNGSVESTPGEASERFVGGSFFWV